MISHPGTILYTQYLHGPAGGRIVNEGSQLVYQPYAIFPIQNFVGGQYTGNGANNSIEGGYTLRDNIFTLDLNRRSTTWVGEATPALPENQMVASVTNQIYLKNVNLDHQWINDSTNPLMFTIHWLMAGRDTKDTPIQTWANQIAFETCGQSNTDSWNIFQANPAAGKPFTTTYGQSPLTIAGFKQFWKCLGTQQFTLQPGSRCHTQTKLRYNYTVFQNLMQQIYDGTTPETLPEHLGGLTIVPLVIVKGFAIKNNTANGNTGTYTYSGGKFGCVIKQDYSFVPTTQTKKFPYNRVISNVWNETWNPASEQTIITQPYSAAAPTKTTG